ncbi:MAG: SOS response-associated peptidase [Leptospiraceae bacterium]|nr:SOS response-associated peptidase [Leptospiraceae bacterium]MCP5510288.1 SOS response-associated peptidase [Leptospiraceae bacterium]
MCGRYVFTSEPGELKSLFPGLEILENFKQGKQISPGQDVAVLRKVQNRYRLSGFHWGLIPPWAKDKKIGYKMINARSETVREKPSFQKPFRNGRCILPANGFYEWKTIGKKKYPHLITEKDSKEMYLAGLCEEWKSDGTTLVSCTILTTSANSMISEVHDRMPVLLTPEECKVWLEERTDEDQLTSLLKPYPSEKMEILPIEKLPSEEGFLFP